MRLQWKYSIFALCLLILIPLLAVPAAAEEPLIDSETACVMDAETGQVLYSKDMHKQMYPASITKVMTGLLALRELNPDDVLTVSQSAYNSVPRTSSHIGLLPGEELTVNNALYALAMESANDAANVLAEAISGSQESFGQHMTEEAEALGAKNTHFANANGLPNSEHYTTAYDMALIACEALKTPGFTDYFGQVTYTFPATNKSAARPFENKNRMLSGQFYDAGVLFSKTGWTSAAQGTLVTAVQRGETTLVVVVMKSIMLESKYRDTQKLLNYCFSQYQRKTVTGEEIAAQLDLGDYFPAPRQVKTFLLPDGVEANELTFSIAQGMEVHGVAEQTAVIVNTALNEQPLPDTTLVLLLSGSEAALAAATEPEPEEEIPLEESPEQTWKSLILPGLVLLIPVALIAELLRQNIRERRKRRKKLERKIRQMKKRMQ